MLRAPHEPTGRPTRLPPPPAPLQMYKYDFFNHTTFSAIMQAAMGINLKPGVYSSREARALGV